MSLPRAMQHSRKRRLEETESPVDEADQYGRDAADEYPIFSEPLQKKIKTMANALIRPLKFVGELLGFNGFRLWNNADEPVTVPTKMSHANSNVEVQTENETPNGANSSSSIDKTIAVRQNQHRTTHVNASSDRHRQHHRHHHGHGHAHGNGKLHTTNGFSDAPTTNRLRKSRNDHITAANTNSNRRSDVPTNLVGRPTNNELELLGRTSNGGHTQLNTSSKPRNGNFSSRSSTCGASINFRVPTPISTLVAIGSSRGSSRFTGRTLYDSASLCSPTKSLLQLAPKPQIVNQQPSAAPVVVQTSSGATFSPYRLQERDQFRALLRKFTSANVQLANVTRLSFPVRPQARVKHTSPTVSKRPVSPSGSTIVISSSSSESGGSENQRKTGEKQPPIAGPSWFTRRSALASATQPASQLKSPTDEFIALPDDAEMLVRHAFRGGPPEEVLVEGFRLRLKRADLLTLAGMNWLNDEVINFYFQMLAERADRAHRNATRDGLPLSRRMPPKVHACNTFFYPKLLSGGHESLKRWTKKLDIFDFDMILIPVHLVVHWCLAVVDFRWKVVRYYDSMGGDNPTALRAILSYLMAEHYEKKRTRFDSAGWRLERAEVPQQLNGSDCGVFACKFADFISRDAPISFTQEHMPYYRRRMVYELLTKRLLGPS